MTATTLTALRGVDLPSSEDPGVHTPSKLSLVGIARTFRARNGEVAALDGISLELDVGKVACLVGPSGCGKSTLLAIAAGLERPDAGQVQLDGRTVSAPGPDRMMLFQEHGLFPWLDALGNAMFGLGAKGLPRAERERIARRHLARVGLADFERAAVHELSGGMKQRLALARCLACEPRVLMMDEPFAALDAITRRRLYSDLERIQIEEPMTILFVTHDVREACILGDVVHVLAGPPGRICESFSIDLPRPRDPDGTDVAAHAHEVADALRRYVPEVGP